MSVIVHEQISDAERERRDAEGDYLHDKKLETKERQRKRGSYIKRDKRGRMTRMCALASFGPGWLSPSGIPSMSTITAYIVWGVYGRMADMPEY